MPGEKDDEGASLDFHYSATAVTQVRSESDAPALMIEFETQAGPLRVLMPAAEVVNLVYRAIEELAASARRFPDDVRPTRGIPIDRIKVTSRGADMILRVRMPGGGEMAFVGPLGEIGKLKQPLAASVGEVPPEEELH